MMNNAEVIKGLEMTINGLTTIKNVLAGDVAESEAPVTKSKSQERREAIQNPVAEGETVHGKFDVDQLNGMKYNEFKKLAASLGVKCTGTREEIMERILALDVEITADSVTVKNSTDEVAEAPVEKKPVKKMKKQDKVEETSDVEEEVEEKKSDKPTGGKRKLAKKATEPTKDEFDEQAEKIATDTPIEDIIDALADVDVKATKKNAVEKLAQALRDGLIEIDDEDEEEESANDVDDSEEDAVEESTDAEDEEEVEADSYFAQYDPNGYNNPDTMSDERKEAIISKMDEILTAVSEEELDFNEIEKYIENHATQDEIDLLGEEYDEVEELKLYMELVKRTIDNDGDEHTESEDPYEVGEHDMCCGHELKYVKKTKKYICEVCGAEYEAE